MNQQINPFFNKMLKLINQDLKVQEFMEINNKI